MRVGIIGFSRTVAHVLAALTTAHLFAAASIIDGVNLGYAEYLSEIDRRPGNPEGEVMMGGAPFGAGLENWIAHSPDFNLDKVTAPLLILAPGAAGAFEEWEPYAALRRLHKPVDMLLLPGGSHVETNPRQRFASAGANIDWFQFWLQGVEDPNPAKVAQYVRWRQLRENADK
jgi:dipeptidyl aminopeptidase/acylaminoacyl peptidase